METCFNYTDKDTGYFSSDERRWINKIRKLKEKFPDQVRIIREPEDNDGCIYCSLPVAWLKVMPKRVLSEDHLAKLHGAGMLHRWESSEHGTNTVEN